MKRKKRLSWALGLAAVAGAATALAWFGQARLNRQSREVAPWVLRMGGEVDYVPAYRINLEGKPVSDADLKRLRGFWRLQSLILAHTKVTDAGLAHLGEMNNVLYPWDSLKSFRPVRYGSSLQTLDLRATQVTDAGLRHLTGLLSLTRLYLGDCPVTDTGLATIKTLKDLGCLDLSGTGVTDAGLAHLADMMTKSYTRTSPSGKWKTEYHGGVRGLDLSNTRLTDAGTAHVAKLGRLIELHLEGTSVTDSSLKRLAKLPELKLLTLDAAAVSGPALAGFRKARPTCRVVLVRAAQRSTALALLRLGGKLEVVGGLVYGSQWVNDVSELRAGPAAVDRADLSHTCALDSDLRLLLEVPGLKRLDLSYTGITDAGLAQVGKLTELTQLHLSHTEVTDAGIVHLRKLTKLEKLDFEKTKVSDASWWQGVPPGLSWSEAPARCDRVHAACFVALAQAKARERGESAETFRRAVSMAEQIAHEVVRAIVLRFVALMQDEAGDHASAARTLRTVLQTVRGFQNAEHEAHLLGLVAGTQGKRGDFAGAYATASKIPRQRPGFALALAEIAAAESRSSPQAAKRDFRRSLQAAQALPNSHERSCALQGLAAWQARAGYFERAQHTVNAITVPNDRGGALLLIAEAQTEAGARSAGLKTLRQAFRVASAKGSGPARGELLILIARAQSKAGGFAQALQTTAAIPDASQALALALAEIGAAQAKAGRRGEAEKTFAQALAAVKADDYALASLAEAQSRAGFLQEAVGTASAIARDYSKVLALRDVAIAQAKAGDKTGATDTFRKALAVAETAEGGHEGNIRPECKPEVIEGVMRRWVGRSPVPEAPRQSH